KTGVDETISLLQNLVLALEEKRLHLMGFRPRPAAVTHSESNGEASVAQPGPTAPAPAPSPQPALSPVQPPPMTATAATSVQGHEADAPVAQPPSAPAVAQPQPEPAPHAQGVQRVVQPQPPQAQHGRKGRSSSEPRVKEAIPPPPVTPPPTVPSPIVTEDSVSVPAPAVVAPPPVNPAAAPEPIPVLQVVTPPLGMSSPQPAHVEADPEVPSQPVPAPAAEPHPISTDVLAVIQRVCLRFHSVARQLRQRSDDRSTLEVEDEVDVQDVLRAVLCAQFEVIQTEAWNPGYANGMARTDLALKQEGIVIVVKKTKQGVGAKTLTDQLGVDIQRYLNHPLCQTLLCFIYDPEGRIGNPAAFEAALVRHKHGWKVEVVISPQ
ncbi:MAG: hypothetical protein ACREJU_14020, partial [Nitrospiraceae bacterium]